MFLAEMALNNKLYMETASNRNQFIIELKIWRGDEYHMRGEEQVFEYLEYYKQDRGYLLSFNFNKNKKSGIQDLEYHGKRILEVIV